jgi:signal transduction histidine kinase
LLVLLASFVSFISFIYKRKQYFFQIGIDELKANHETELLKSKILVQEQTFQNISREIHDNIGQKLTFVKLQLNNAEAVAEGTHKEMLASSVQIITECLSDLRDLSRSLSSEHIANNGFIKALENEIFQLNKLGRINFTLRITGESFFLTAEKEIIIFRIIQESLNNVIKHAEASKVLISLYYTETNLSISIEDNGKGFLPKNVKDSNGINNIIKRAESLKGVAEFSSELGRGTIVNINIPYDEK